jgi:hypothetical protein
MYKKLVRKYKKKMHTSMTSDESDGRKHAIKGKTKEQRN